MDRFRRRLTESSYLISDGALGTLLLGRGLLDGGCPERLNLERPDVLSEIARSYAEAGADIVATNSFGASPLKLALYGLDEQSEVINRAAVRAARSGVPEHTLVAASCGPTGRLLLPYGDTEPDEVYLAFRRQFEAVCTEGVDLIFLETMSDLAEARLALRAAKEVSGSVPVAVTLTFENTPSGFRTIMGTGVEEVVHALDDDGADMVGSNCGLGSEAMVALASEFRRHTDGRLLMQPNAGLPRLEGDVAMYPESPEFMAERARQLFECGVEVVGGCCGTTPAHIRALRHTVDLFHGTALRQVAPDPSLRG